MMVSGSRWRLLIKPLCDGQVHGWSTPTDFYPRALPFTYFPIINFNRFLVAAGIVFRSVRIAWARADPHLHVRSRGISAIVCRTTLHAFSAFLTSTATIWSTVTES